MTQAPTHLHVLISGGFSGAYETLLAGFLKSGVEVTTGSGASQGKGPQTIAAQLARGAPADVVILSREGLNDLIAAGRIVAGTDVDLAEVPLGVGVRAGAPKPDLRSVEGFKQVLLTAKTVAVPESTSGIWLIDELFPRLGIAGRINVRPAPRGSESAVDRAFAHSRICHRNDQYSGSPMGSGAVRPDASAYPEKCVVLNMIAPSRRRAGINWAK